VETFLTPDGFGNGLGWAMSGSILPVGPLPPGSFGHTGFTGTLAVAIPSRGIGLVLLTNRQNVGTQPDGTYTSLAPLQRQLTELVLQELP
jgi:CubicO group peptidase (beta-lactamase class C family)